MTPVAAPSPSSAHSPATDPAPWKWTRNDFLRFHELGLFGARRVMLIDGEVLALSPINEPHARSIVFVLQALQAAFGSGFTFRPQMPMDLGQTTDPEPDVIVVAGAPRTQPPTPPTTAVLVVEVADSSLAFDLGDKANLSAAAGISEYWVVDLVQNQLHVFRDPRPEPGKRFGHVYARHTLNSATDRVSPLAAPQSLVLVGDLLP